MTRRTINILYSGCYAFFALVPVLYLLTFMSESNQLMSLLLTLSLFLGLVAYAILIYLNLLDRNINAMIFNSIIAAAVLAFSSIALAAVALGGGLVFTALLIYKDMNRHF